MISNEDFLFLAQKAILAPSGHNAQAWKFRRNGDAVEVLPDLNRCVKVGDPDNRELYISLGCAVENLCMAAPERGFRADAQVLQDGSVRVELAPRRDASPSPLAAQIPIRQTTRSRYTGKSIPQATLNLLAETPLEPETRLYLYPNGSQEFAKLEGFVLQATSIQMQNPEFVAELRQWIRHNKKEENSRMDGISYAAFGAPSLPSFLAKPIFAKAMSAKALNKTNQSGIHSASHLALFTTHGNDKGTWIALGRSLERFLLATTAQGIAHSYLNQPMETEGLPSLIATELGMNGEVPQLLLRIGYGPLRPRSARRGVAEFILPDAP